ncbi:hypothetical protein Pcinc_037917 [Petrolisthes cinctipes]|uniref:Uncharacterized protein n=1 Tax=Petrolisthes cinctipes TaxID=88211 RepID=A0AAE1ENI3_PETCI|nr:hypothetical protein Pcinc_037917 [Petrolisthes cinctipes]
MYLDSVSGDEREGRKELDDWNVIIVRPSWKTAGTFSSSSFPHHPIPTPPSPRHLTILFLLLLHLLTSPSYPSSFSSYLRDLVLLYVPCTILTRKPNHPKSPTLCQDRPTPVPNPSPTPQPHTRTPAPQPNPSTPHPNSSTPPEPQPHTRTPAPHPNPSPTP